MFTIAQGAFITYAEKVAGMKERLSAPKFKEHFHQATLFFNSLSPRMRPFSAAFACVYVHATANVCTCRRV